MRRVYHGSYMEVAVPKIEFSREKLDFGKGFYVTPLREQALLWAKRWQKRQAKSVLNIYIYEEERIEELGFKVKTFPNYDLKWLRFIAENRQGKLLHHYDIISGGIANDKVFNTLELYLDNLISEKEALKRLKFEKPNWQICFCQQYAIENLLSFEGSEEVTDVGQ